MTPLQTLFNKQANMFFINNDEERFTKMYVCLASFLEAEKQEEEWTKDKTTIENINLAITNHPKKYLFLRLLKEYEKTSMI